VKLCFVGQKDSRFNLRVSKNHSSKHSFYLELVSHEKALHTDPD
jgi:hypothetical protein